MYSMDEIETAPADTTSSDHFLPSSLPPLYPLSSGLVHPSSSHLPIETGKMRPVGVAHPVRQTPKVAMETNDPTQLTLKSLPSRDISVDKGFQNPISFDVTPEKPETDITGISNTIFQNNDDSSSISNSSYEMTPTHIVDEPHKDEGMYPLPKGKHWHVFVSHSTADQQWVKENVIIPLRDKPDYKEAVSCSDFMPDSTKYNDQAIHDAMTKSCVILLSLTPAYINSVRCQREWKNAVRLSNMQTHTVIVIAVSVCNRPEILKQFLYLDFINRTKREVVWNKLIQTIDSMVTELTSFQLLDSSNQHASSPPQSSNLSQNMRRTDSSVDQEFDSYQYELEHAFETELQNLQQDRSWVSRRICGRGEDECEDGKIMEREEEEREEEDENDEQEEGEEEKKEEEEEEEEEGEGEEEKEEKILVIEKENEHKEEKQRKRLREDEMEEGELSDSVSPEDQVPKSKIAKKTDEKRDKDLGEEEEGGFSSTESSDEILQSKVVANFYDNLAKPGMDNRNESPIFHMRNFNNWVKSILLRSYIPPKATALDLCCGKGGDLNKWKEGGIEYVVCADISEVSVDHCKGRYHGTKMMNRRTKKPFFESEFIVADCCVVRLRDEYVNPGRRFHITSCQFSLHYSFESFEKATMMLRNACENLRPGGYFVGTTVDSNELIRRLRDSGKQNEDGCWYVGNDVYSVTMDTSIDPGGSQLPLFECKYHFSLADVVNVPEYLVHYPLLVRMLKEMDMEEIVHQNFYDFFAEHRHIPDDIRLMYNMGAFNKRTGTISPSEWEVIGLYLIFVFKKLTTST